MKMPFSVTIILIAFMLAGCTLPPIQTTPQSNLVATAVSQTLTSQPIQITPLQTQPPLQVPTNTIVAVASDTPTLEPTALPSPTATLQPESPRSSLGDATRTYNFEDGVAFGLQETYDDGNTRFFVSDGKLYLTSLNVNGFRGWRLTSARPDDFYMEADFRTQQCAGKDQYGLVFRAEDFESGKAYYLGISCDGHYRLTKWTDGGTATVKDWTFSDFIAEGSNQSNRIGVYARGRNITVYANDQKVGEIDDSSLTSEGYIGFFVAGEEVYGFTVEVDSLSYWDR